VASNTTAAAPCTPWTVAFGPLLRSTITAGREEKSCADEDDAHGAQSGERASDVSDKHGFLSDAYRPVTELNVDDLV
jgi:hypothetical protein